MSLHEKCDRLWEARINVRPVTAFSAAEPSFTLEEGYAVQEALLERAVEKGDRLVGYKMGLTSRAKQKDVNVDSPIRGFLLASFEEEKGGTVDITKKIHPRVEPEVAMILKSGLGETAPTLRDVKAAVGSVVPALEILDSRYEAFSFKLSDVVADNTSASGFMLGQTELLGATDLPLWGVTIKKNGEILETGCPAAVFGDPYLSLLGLARAFYKDGKKLLPGQVILTGGITAAVPFAHGDTLEVIWPGETLTFRAERRD